MYKARHKLDGNLYAIKKIKLQKDINSEENKRIRREITYLSGLNNRYIVRYFQTWVERETDPEKIAEFGDEDDDYYGEGEESEEEERFDIADSSETGWSARDQKKLRGRSSSPGRRKTGATGAAIPRFKGALQAADSDDSSEHDAPVRRPRAGTDNFQRLGGRPGQGGGKREEQPFSEDDSSTSEQLVLGHEQDDEFGPAFGPFAEDDVSQPSPGGSGLSGSPVRDGEAGITILYIQMQYCEGQTLLEFTQQHPWRE